MRRHFALDINTLKSIDGHISAGKVTTIQQSYNIQETQINLYLNLDFINTSYKSNKGYFSQQTELHINCENW